MNVKQGWHDIRRVLGWESEPSLDVLEWSFWNAVVVTRVDTNVVLLFLLFYVIKSNTCIDLCHLMKSVQVHVYVTVSFSSMKYAVCARTEVAGEPFPIVCLTVENKYRVLMSVKNVELNKGFWNDCFDMFIILYEIWNMMTLNNIAFTSSTGNIQYLEVRPFWHTACQFVVSIAYLKYSLCFIVSSM